MDFIDDVSFILEKAKQVIPDSKSFSKLEKVAWKLTNMYEKGLVKSNHSVMELVLACHLIKKGYNVDVEYDFGGGLICDIYAERDGESLAVEVETGFVPPENSKDPVAYRAAREISKVVRYSRHVDFFALATPPYHILQLPDIFFLPPGKRGYWGLKAIKNFLDKYYKRPPIEVDELIAAKLNYVYVVVVDELLVLEYKAGEYYMEYLEKPRRELGRYFKGEPFLPLYNIDLSSRE
ncbi:MAG: hypothetical protein DRJ38_06360 [Thermoprotei archaeon]|nr:MAG: hypothetical protein DRJ38_06360 [Thermoprotei archaeon]